MKRSTPAPQPRHRAFTRVRPSIRHAVWLLLALLVASACGKKGPPLAPIVRVPAAPDSIQLRTRADSVAFQFRIPAANSDGSTPADIRAVEVYGYTGTPSDDAAIVRNGTLVASLPVRERLEDEDAKEGAESKEAPARPPSSMTSGFEQGETVVVFETLGPEQRRVVVAKRDKELEPLEETDQTGGPLGPDVAAAAPQRIYLSVGVSRKGRRGAFSPRSLAPLRQASSSASKPEVSYDEKQVTLRWEPPADLRLPTLPTPAGEGLLEAKPLGMESSADGHNVYLQTPAEEGSPRRPDDKPGPQATVSTRTLPAPLNSSLLFQPTFQEPVTAFGSERCYEVTTVSRYGGATVESEPSPAACVTLVDTFPPAAPAGLAAVGSQGAINLIWSAGEEADLAGYLVLRAEGEGELAALTTDPISQATYRDEAVKPGVRYSYAVVAVDNAGNRSTPSNRVEESGREP